MNTLLSINNYFYKRGGAETIFLEQNRLFKEIGWKVVPFCMKHEKNQHSRWAEFFVDELEFGAQYSVFDKIIRAPKVLYSSEAARKISKVIELSNPQIAHAHNVYHHLSPSVLRAVKSAGVPLVMTLHDLKIACPAYTMLSGGEICEKCRGGRFYQVVNNRCIKESFLISVLVMFESYLHSFLKTYWDSVDVFVTPSQFYANKFAEWALPIKRMEHVPNFVDLPVVNSEPNAGDYFLYVGRLSAEKGVGTLIEAAGVAGVDLVIVGEGPDEMRLRRLAERTLCKTTFCGFLTGIPLKDAFAGARAIVLPSEWYENGPVSILEAYAYGKPVIGSNIGGIPEMIVDGETGSTFSVGSVEELGELLCGYWNMPASEVIAMGYAGRCFAASNYGRELYGERIGRIYSELM